MHRITVSITDEQFDSLRESARAEHRSPRDEAAARLAESIDRDGVRSRQASQADTISAIVDDLLAEPVS